MEGRGQNCRALSAAGEFKHEIFKNIFGKFRIRGKML